MKEANEATFGTEDKRLFLRCVKLYFLCSQTLKTLPQDPVKPPTPVWWKLPVPPLCRRQAHTSSQTTGSDIIAGPAGIRSLSPGALARRANCASGGAVLKTPDSTDPGPVDRSTWSRRQWTRVDPTGPGALLNTEQLFTGTLVPGLWYQEPVNDNINHIFF